MARIELDKAAREALARLMVRRLKDDLDLEIAPMDGQRLLDLFSETAGAFYYNQGLYDARAVVEDRAAALAEAIDGLERPTPR
jgi:uncharacterized protein (DUF2164 family)